MSTSAIIVLVILLLLLFGGLGGHYGRTWFGGSAPGPNYGFSPGYAGGGIGVVLVIVLILFLLGVIR